MEEIAVRLVNLASAPAGGGKPPQSRRGPDEIAEIDDLIKAGQEFVVRGDFDQCRAVVLDCFEEQIEDRRLVGGVEVTLPPDEIAEEADIAAGMSGSLNR